MTHKKSKSLNIVGGGITGLSAAYIASKNGYKVSVFESSTHFGGLLSTFAVGGNRLEYYYHHFFTHDKEIAWLIRELNLENKLHFRKTSMGVFREGKIYNFNSIKDLIFFSPLNFFHKIRFAFSSLFLGKFAKWYNYESISALDWFYKYAGVNVTDSLWKPLLDIKFGPFSKFVPLSWMIGRLRQRINSRKKGEEQLGYLKGSLSVLLDELLKELKSNDVCLYNNSKVDDLIIDSNNIIGISSNNTNYMSDITLITIPSNYISELISSYNKQLSIDLNKVEYFGAVCVVLELTSKLSDIYWLNVADKGYPFGGIIEHTNFVSPKEYNGKHIVYLSRYFAHNENVSKMNSQEIIDYMIPYLSKVYKNFDKDSIENINVFKTQTAATVCDINFSKKIINCKTDIDNLFIANMMHVYPDERSVNNSIRLAAEACRVMGINSKFVPKGSSISAIIGFN